MALKSVPDSLVALARHLKGKTANGDERYSSIIIAESLERDKEVLTVEPEIENTSKR